MIMAHLGHALGALAGFIGISIAIYLQLVAARECDWRWVLLFFSVGSATLMANAEAFGAPADYTGSIMAIGYAILIIAQLAVGYWVYENSDVRSPYDMMVNGGIQEKP